MQMRVALLFIAVTTGTASADCIYLNAYTSQRYLAVLDEEDLAELFSFALPPDTGFGRVTGMVVVGEHAYLHHVDPSDDPGRVVEVDLVQGRVSREVPTGRLGFSLAHAAGKLYAPNAGDDTVTVVDLATGHTAAIGGVGDFPTDVAAVPDGTRILIYASGAVSVIDTALDRPIHSFATYQFGSRILATDDLVFVGGSRLVVFEKGDDAYAEIWRAPLGVCFRLAIADGKLFCAGGRFLTSVDLAEPHEGSRVSLGTDPGADLHDIEAHDGTLYVAAEKGLFRIDPRDLSTAALVYPGSFREVEVAPCPPPPSTFAGDADCDLVLGTADLDATSSAIYDRAARAACDADCNADGRVDAADLLCAVRELAGPVIVHFSPTPFPTRTPRPPTPTRIPTWTPGACASSLDCPPTGFCSKPPGHCDDPGTCIEDGGDYCLAYFDPVCGCDGSTHSNAGCAAAAGVNVDYPGACRDESLAR
jgi:hypothetical protein